MLSWLLEFQNSTAYNLHDIRINEENGMQIINWIWNNPVKSLMISTILSIAPVIATFFVTFRFILDKNPYIFPLGHICVVTLCIYGIISFIIQCFNPNIERIKQLVYIIINYFFIIFAFANLYYYSSFMQDSKFAMHELHKFMITEMYKQKFSEALPPPFLVGDGFSDNKFWKFSTKLNVESPPNSNSEEDIRKWLIDSIFIKDLNGAYQIYFDCLYFSSITITTIGYGDIRPAINTAKMLVMLEAISGQIIWVVAIAELFKRS